MQLMQCLLWRRSPADVRRMLLCRVGVGRAFVLDDVDGERVIPPGYDSLYVHTPVDTDGDGKVSADEFEIAATHAGRPSEAYSHSYVICDGTQVLPAYLVQFKFVRSTGEGDRPCDVCESSRATLFCAADNAYLCTDCDEETHSANKLVRPAHLLPLLACVIVYRVIVVVCLYACRSAAMYASRSEALLPNS